MAEILSTIDLVQAIDLVLMSLDFAVNQIRKKFALEARISY
jgi:hypothetical protein